MKQNNESTRGNRIAFLALLILILLLFLLHFCSRSPQRETETGAVLFEEAQPTSADTQERLNQTVEEGYLVVHLKPQVTFVRGSDPGTIEWVNESKSRYPQRMEIRWEETGELLYTSALLPVGYAVPSIRLQRTLPAGQYTAIARIFNVSPDTGENLGSAQVRITLRVLT